MYFKNNSRLTLPNFVEKLLEIKLTFCLTRLIIINFYSYFFILNVISLISLGYYEDARDYIANITV